MQGYRFLYFTLFRLMLRKCFFFMLSILESSPSFLSDHNWPFKKYGVTNITCVTFSKDRACSSVSSHSNKKKLCKGRKWKLNLHGKTVQRLFEPLLLLSFENVWKVRVYYVLSLKKLFMRNSNMKVKTISDFCYPKRSRCKEIS